MPSYNEYHNLWGAARAYFALKQKKPGRPMLIITPDMKSYDTVVSDFKLFAQNIAILPFPSYSQDPFEEARVLPSVMSRRSDALYKALHLDDFILITSPYSLMKKVPKKKDFLSCELLLQKGATLPREELEYTLDILGYIHVEFVTGPGEYNIRGGLADLFPIEAENPIRIEYFDDEIEQIFYYNPENQSRVKLCDSLRILPCSDLLLSTEEFADKAGNADLKERAETYGKFAGYHWYAPYVGYELDTVFDYLPTDITVVSLAQDFKQELENFSKSVYDLAKDKRLLENFLTYQDAVRLILERDAFVLSEIGGSTDSLGTEIRSTKSVFAFEKKNIYQSLTNAMTELAKLYESGYKIILGVESDKFRGIFKEFARDYDVMPPDIENISGAKDAGVYIYPHQLSGGFIDTDKKIAAVADVDIFGFTKRKPKQRKKDVFNTSLSDLEDGDYVVHTNHGIGIYRGIKHLTIAGLEGDFLDILYDGDDILYVPLQSINQIQKYVGLQDHKPKLNSLKSSAWAKLKKQAKQSARSVAEDLLRLYAERKAKKGYAFCDDGEILSGFERDFEYDETEDQLSAIIDVYRDMESDTPMERLVCGDVGFGKTEVAMRAACKACACGKQVAVLVPTTILARQHHETFAKRFANLPIEVDFVSRFRTAAECRAIFEKTAKGELDIIIGTHKLLSKELSFKDLGLLVIDEEQRFGVSHKEKIAAMKRNVDTLTLSATPIPRTLQLSLSGIRDMSIIETPPENRLPVVVKVIKGDEGVKIAMLSELERGGQVFFLHNRVSDLQDITLKVKEMLPHARVDYAHGQMDSRSMENILQSFYAGDIDVLVSTTIIENGIDIPNVNTIVIHKAANFGLSQLYQLKGRVGRSSRRGYCFLAVDNFAALTPIAQKRLSIIQQLSDLGSGFKIAMYDLQLRGAGNILGAEQSGFVVRVGYELYVQMIEDAVNEMKGEISSLTDVEINSNLAYFIPADYIEDPRARFEFYRRFSAVQDRDSMMDLLSELDAAYGELKPEVRSLAYIMLIKNLASRLAAVAVHITKLGGKIKFAPNTKLLPDIVKKAAGTLKIIYRFSSEYELSIAVDDPTPPEILVEFLERLNEFSSEPQDR